MKILAIDTSSNICSVCLLENDKPLHTLEIKNEKTHSEKLMPLVQELLNVAKITLNEIDLIACDKGPGSFTGIRIGISSVKAMAEVQKLNIVGVSSLESLAYNEIFDGIICSLIDARNNQVYCGIFDSNRNQLGELMADDISIVLETIENLWTATNSNYLGTCGQVPLQFIGDGAVLHQNIIKEKFQTNANFSKNNEQTSISIGRCAYHKFLNGQIDSADSITPLYLRKSQAERMQDVMPT
ncbi:MAG: tRNA (adenosine(37)-N6)-threonylcarbamoyltransferase complex dimerization subunit type 1 TsaB [Oscillospiraceae bacterium]|nr:tRNA (adenosine(37)-N6)-threonylcarbamoyltransferase complex dimerization subunit type 1 TsaB [Oscillospiraceae bacterium]